MRHVGTYMLLSAVLLAAGAARAQEAASARLEYRAEAFDVPLAVQPDAEVRFRKAPADVEGYAVAAGPERKNLVGIGVDLAGRKLYVDLNRNLNLMDDPGAVVKLPRAVERGAVAFQADIFDPLPGPRHYRLDLLYGRYPDGFPLQGKIRSGWEGTIALNGENWNVAVVDDLDGIIAADSHHNPYEPPLGGDLLLIYRDRGHAPDPWTRGVLYGGPAADYLWLNGRHYKVDYAIRRDFGHGALEITFAENPGVDMGIIEVAGQDIERLILYGAHTVVVLDAPSGRVSVPAGNYANQEIRLYDTQRKLCYRSMRSKPLRVNSGATAQLDVGGPLDNRILVDQDFTRLNLDYALLGAGGEPYKCVNPPNRPPDQTLPHYAAYYKGEKVLSGQFEYG